MELMKLQNVSSYYTDIFGLGLLSWSVTHSHVESRGAWGCTELLWYYVVRRDFVKVWLKVSYALWAAGFSSGLVGCICRKPNFQCRLQCVCGGGKSINRSWPRNTSDFVWFGDFSFSLWIATYFHSICWKKEYAFMLNIPVLFIAGKGRKNKNR